MILAEIETRDALGAVTMLYLATADYNHPTAPGFYEGRLRGDIAFTRSAYAGGTTSGSVAVGFGVIAAANPDGGLDALLSAGLEGGRVTLKWLESASDAYTTAVTIAVLSMEQPEFTFNEVRFRVKDRLADLEARKLQTARYLGTTVTTGIEGGADQKGKVKPDLYGLNRDISPVLVNPALLIYQARSGAVNAISAVYDRGAALTVGSVYADLAAMEATAPAIGQFRACPSIGCFRLGGAAAGTITADVTTGAAAANRTAAQILNAMATGPGGLTAGEVSAADVTALDSANSAVIGLFAGEEISVRAAMELVSNSIGAWFGFDRLGILRMNRLAAPTGSPVISLRRIRSGYGEEAAPANAVDIISIERKPLEDQGRGVPVQTATLTYSRCWTPQTSDLAGAVQTNQARREFLAAETRKATATDASVLLQFPNAGTRAFDSLIDDATAAQTEVDRLLALHKARRDRYQVMVRLDLALLSLLDLGATVEIRLNRFGLNTGKLFTVIGLTPDLTALTIELDLWG